MNNFRAISLILLVSYAKGFSSPSQPGGIVRPKPVQQLIVATTTTPTRSSTTTLFQESSLSSAASEKSNRPPKFLFKLNSSTKWLVTFANTLGIWTRFPHYEGPFIVVGAIAATYFTAALKKWINHDRPEGAPFTDPGMPSSHSLVSFFMAAAWGSAVCKGMALPLVWLGASVVAFLRVICGYHSWDQIGVGALLGSSMGFGWAKLGSFLFPIHPQIMLRVFWGFYLSGSVLYIFTEMKDWLHKDKHL